MSWRTVEEVLADRKKRGLGPSPGSREALAEGCVCARMDNYNGAGLQAGYGTPEDPAFWITEGCPLHSPPWRKAP